MNYFAVLYSLDGLLVARRGNATKAGEKHLPFEFKEIGYFNSFKDAVMVARAMTGATLVVKDFLFHVKRERWCLYNEKEFLTLLSELGIRTPKRFKI